MKASPLEAKHASDAALAGHENELSDLNSKINEVGLFGKKINITKKKAKVVNKKKIHQK